MTKYGIATKPLHNKLAMSVDSNDCKQIWYADGSSPAEKVHEMRKWRDILCQDDPKYGYFPLATKTILIVKAEWKEKVEEAFRGSTIERERHISAVIWSASFKDLYGKGKIDKWIRDVEEVAEIAEG